MADDPGGNAAKPSGRLTPAERRALQEKADRLAQEIGAARGEPEPVGGHPGKAYGYVAKLAIDLVIGPLIGGAMGWWLDQQFGTGPFLMLLFGAFGVAAAVRSATGTYKQMSKELGQPDQD